ncbi:4442_t:CDS:2 [Dentiscutata heterogama]|uniref:4442_t:CDS:1 n=1 Tax=Dentiscutata heterogama TaxID=1316150 RepID=A0ACA9K7C1_9GLOM|nr:4442_t:CDS:2 [Dentiscutata heterogama]
MQISNKTNENETNRETNEAMENSIKQIVPVKKSNKVNEEKGSNL